eukprot:jgi/Bigna1/90616/estExt_fgenesh1_pg.C_750004
MKDLGSKDGLSFPKLISIEEKAVRDFSDRNKKSEIQLNKQGCSNPAEGNALHIDRIPHLRASRKRRLVQPTAVRKLRQRGVLLLSGPPRVSYHTAYAPVLRKKLLRKRRAVAGGGTPAAEVPAPPQPSKPVAPKIQSHKPTSKPDQTSTQSLSQQKPENPPNNTEKLSQTKNTNAKCPVDHKVHFKGWITKRGTMIMRAVNRRSYIVQLQKPNAQLVGWVVGGSVVLHGTYGSKSRPMPVLMSFRFEDKMEMVFCGGQHVKISNQLLLEVSVVGKLTKIRPFKQQLSPQQLRMQLITDEVTRRNMSVERILLSMQPKTVVKKAAGDVVAKVETVTTQKLGGGETGRSRKGRKVFCRAPTPPADLLAALS